MANRDGSRPESLALRAIVIKDHDVFFLPVKRMKQARGGAIPRTDGRASGKPLRVDVVMSGDEVAEGFRVELGFGSPRRRIRRAVTKIVMIGPDMGA